MPAAAGRPRMTPRTVAQPEGPAVRGALALYEATAALPLRSWPEAPDELADYLELIYAGLPDAPPAVLRRTGPAEPWGRLADDGRMWVAYTGGKDSVSAALRAQEQGHSPVLYHLAGLNRGMGDEPRYAARTAARQGWPLLVERVHVQGAKAGVMELPTKNQVTALFLTQRMAGDGGARYCTGWHSSDDQRVQDFGYDYSDGVQAIAAFNAYLSARWPGLEYRQQLQDTTEAWATIAGAGLMQYIKGCVCPLRYKASLRARNVAKWGWLLASRCGSCVKCGWEEHALQALGVLPADEARLAHGRRWMVRDFGERVARLQAAPPPGLERLAGLPLEEAVVEFLVPEEGVAPWRRPFADWPDQPAPADEAEGCPSGFGVDEWRWDPGTQEAAAQEWAAAGA